MFMCLYDLEKFIFVSPKIKKKLWVSIQLMINEIFRALFANSYQVQFVPNIKKGRFDISSGKREVKAESC